jgi:2-polyprenyl-6-methoxyphenol hydroxylase-like FAD-dependent oxidoreductase
MNSNNEKHFLSGKRIIVSGAGIGGLTFCIALQQFLDKTSEKIEPPPSIIVHERDTSVDPVGREGYSLSLRGDPLSGGMQTLNKLGILDEMINESNPGTYFTLFNNDFSPLIQMRTPPIEGLSRSSIRIARAKLREILVKNVHSSIPIKWDSAVKSVKELENGNVLVDLSDGTQEECHLLIAADGANSAIRRLIRPEHQLHFTGAVSLTGRTHALDKFPSPLDKTFGGAIGGDGHFLFVASSDRTSALWGVSYLSPTPRQAKSPGTMTDEEIDEILEEAKQRTKVFSEPLPTLLKATLRSTVAIFNANDLKPFRNHGSVIFIGDAQHAMSPFAGNGANMAIMDGYQLADKLINSKDLNTAIKSYDDLSIPRSKTAIKMSHRSISAGHSQGIHKFIMVNVMKMIGWYYGVLSHDEQENK